MTVLMGRHDSPFVVFEWGQRQTSPGWIRAGGTGVSARRLSADPGVLSRSSMDEQGCLCTQVLGDYLLKVIWDHGVPLIIPESIQHLHLLCASIAPLQRQRKHLQVSVKPASRLKKKQKTLEVGFFQRTRLWSSCSAAYILPIPVCLHTLNLKGNMHLDKKESKRFVLTTGFPVCMCVCPARHTSPAQLNLSNSQWHTCFRSCRAWMDGGVCCPGPGEHSGRGGKCPAEWKMAACEESVCSQLRPWQETVRAVLLLLHLPPPVIDLHFHFANNTSTALMMERPISLLCSAAGAKVCTVFCNAARW